MEMKSFEESLLEYLGQVQHNFFFDPKNVKRGFQRQLVKEQEKEFPKHLQKMLRTVLQGKRILEVGSGSGWRSVSLGLHGGEVYGMEPVEAGVQTSILRSRKHDNLNIEFRRGVAEDLPYPNDFFDMVISFQVIEHVQNVEQSLREMYRVLKPGGIIYMETGNSLYPREEHYGIFWIPYMPKIMGKIYVCLRGKNPAFLDRVNFIYRGAILKKMKQAGFTENREMFKSHVLSKFKSPDRVTNPMYRKILGVFKKLHVLNAFGFLVANIGFYPSLWLLGKKPKNLP